MDGSELPCCRFLDILQEAPLFGHRKSRSLVGSYLYLILLAGYAVLAAGAPWIFHHLHHLTPSLLCCCDVALLILTGFPLIFSSLLIFLPCYVFQSLRRSHLLKTSH